MKTKQRYLKEISEEKEARDWMAMKNQASRDGNIYCLVAGPSDNWAIVDVKTAIELGGPYEWSVR